MRCFRFLFLNIPNIKTTKFGGGQHPVETLVKNMKTDQIHANDSFYINVLPKIELCMNISISIRIRVNPGRNHKKSAKMDLA